MRRLRCSVRTLHREKKFREGRDITYDEVAEAVELTVRTISRYMNDQITRYDRETLEKFCDYYDCGIEDILVLEEPERRGNPAYMPGRGR